MTFGVYSITGNPAFDYFFTLTFVIGCIAVGPMLLFKLFKW